MEIKPGVGRDVMNSEEAARFLGLHLHTLYNWKYLKRGPAWTKVGRRTVYLLEDLENFRRRNRVDPEA
jgi:hypothetical protein